MPCPPDTNVPPAGGTGGTIGAGLRAWLRRSL